MKQNHYPRLDETVVWDKLPNGLTLAVVPRKGFQKKLAYFVTDFGSLHTSFLLDGREYTAPMGVAHYLEHKLFDMPEGEVSAAFAALGASVNAFTSYDLTAYYFSCTENFYESLELLLKFVSTPYFAPESVEREKGIIGQEIDMTADTPDARLFEQLMEAMYTRHPICQPILGTAESIREITPQVLTDCHRAFYTPENMMLCVVGDVDAEAITALAVQVLGDSPRQSGKKLRPWQEAMTPAVPEVRCAMEVAMPMFQLGFKCEPTGHGAEAIRMEVIGDLAAEALFGESSRLYLRLYEEGLIDASFGGGFETVEAMAMLTASGDSDAPEQVREEILAQAESLAAVGLDEQDLLRMKRSLLGRRLRDLDSFDSTCFRLCAYYFSGFDYMDFPAVVESVTVKEVLDFIQRVVKPERCCLSVITPLSQEVTT